MLMAVVTGEIDIAVSDPAGFAAYIKSEQVRVLATTASQRMPTYPSIPTMLESEVAFKLDTFNGLFARRGTSPEVLTKLAELFKASAATPEMRAYLQANALDGYVVTGTEASTRVDSDIVRWKQLTQDAGVVAK
jgi:tripartite-type tricarboxylate transporter receptor subunit TctC